MMAEPHWSLVKGTIFSDKPKLADFGPLVASFLGGCGKNENTFRSFTGTPEPTHIWLVGSHMIPFCSLFGMTIQIDTDIFQCSLATR
jgi:hypothetical protein